MASQFKRKCFTSPREGEDDVLKFLNKNGRNVIILYTFKTNTTNTLEYHCCNLDELKEYLLTNKTFTVDERGVVSDKSLNRYFYKNNKCYFNIYKTFCVSEDDLRKITKSGNKFFHLSTDSEYDSEYNVYLFKFKESYSTEDYVGTKYNQVEEGNTVLPIPDVKSRRESKVEKSFNKTAEKSFNTTTEIPQENPCKKRILEILEAYKE